MEQRQVNALFDYMRDLAAKGVSMIFTSHRLWEVLEICDDVVVFRNGMNVGELDFKTGQKDSDEIIKMITGEAEARHHEKKYEKISGETMLKVEHLNYGKYLKGVSFELKKGEILGIGGLQGQGQSELMLALAGNYKETKGHVEIKGKKIDVSKPANAIRNGMFLVPGDRQVQGLMLKDSLYTNIIYPQTGF